MPFAFFKVVRSHWAAPPRAASQHPAEAKAEVAEERRKLEQEKLRVPQRNFTLQFEMGEVRYHLLDETRQPLALASFSGFLVTYENGPRACLRMTMHSASVDGIEAGGATTRFASSLSAPPSSSAPGSAPPQDFVKIERGWINPNAPNHPGYDLDWDLDFSRLNINWNASTVKRLTTFYSAAFSERKAAEVQLFVEAPQEAGDSAFLEGQELLEVQDEMAAITKDAAEWAARARERTQVTASFQSLSATLMRDGIAVVRMEMTAASCKYEGAAQGSKTSGKLGNFVVVDLSREEGHFKEKLGLRDTSQSVVTFQSHRYVSGSEGYPGYDSMLVVEMSSTRFVYTRGFMEELRQYISEEPLIGSIMGMTASAVAESAKKAAGHHRRGQGLMKVKCRLVNPLVVLPADEGREEALVADLGEILLENRFEAGSEGRAEHFAVQVKAMNLREAGGSFLMENVDLGFHGSRRLDTIDISVLEACLAVSDVKVAFSCAQVELASRIWFQVVLDADPDAPRTPSTFNDSSTFNEDEQEDVFLEASDVEPWLQRREWTFGITCPALVASVRESDLGSDRGEIARVRIAGVAFDGVLTAGKTEGTLTVSAADIVDSCSSNSERLLLSSAPSSSDSSESSEAGPAASSGHLATIRYVRWCEDAPGHPGYDKGWDLNSKGLLLNWNDKTVALLMRFYEGVRGAVRAGTHAEKSLGAGGMVSEASVQAGEQDANAGDKQPEEAHVEVAATGVGGRTQITASIELLSATLMRDGAAVVRMEVTAASCKYEGAAQGSKTSGKLGNFVVVDLSREEGHFKEKLGLRDTSQSVVTFQSHRYVSGSEGYPGYDSMLVVEMSSTRFVYTRGFMEELRQYISEEPLIGSIMGMTASAVAESAKKAAGHHRRGQGLMKVKCRLVNPLVVLPADEGREEALVADLGEILLENRFEAGSEGRAEHFAVQVKAMNLREAGGGYLLEKVDLGLDGHRCIGDGIGPAFEFDVTMSDLNTEISERQLLLARRVVLAFGSGRPHVAVSGDNVVAATSASEAVAESFGFRCRAHLKGAALMLVQEANVREGGKGRREIAVCRVSDVDVSYSSSPSRSHFEFAVASIGIEDLTAARSQGKSLLTSVASGESPQRLVSVKSVWVLPGAPDHPGYDRGWDLDFQSLELFWNDKTVALLMRFYESALSEMGVGAREADGSIAQVGEEQGVDDETVTSQSGEEVQNIGGDLQGGKTKMQVSASIQSLSATLMRDGAAVVRMEMTAASCKYEGAAQGSKTSGKLGNFVVVDLSREEGHFKEKLGLRDTSQSVVTFQSHRYVSGSEGYPGYDSMLVVEMSSTRFVYTRGFMEELRQYISEEPLIGSIMGMTASAVAESAKKAAGHHRRGQGLMKVKCRLVNPLVVLPADEGREEALVADLGEILLENRFEAGSEGRAEHFAVQVKAMNLREAGGSFLMENVDLALDGHRVLASSGATPQGPMVVEATVSDVLASVCQRQVALLLAISCANFLSSPPPRNPTEPLSPAAASPSPSPRRPPPPRHAAPPASAGARITASVSRVLLSAFDDREGSIASERGAGSEGRGVFHTKLELVSPHFSYEVSREGGRTVGCSVVEMEVVHAGAGAEGGSEAGPEHILRYYDENGTGRGGDTPGSREPQLRCEWHQGGEEGEGGRVSVRLFRPEAVLLPSALVSMYSYVDGLAHRLALVPGGGAGDASGQTGQTGQSGPMHAPAGGATPLRTLPGIEEASLGAGGGGSRGGGVRVDVEVRKPRISLVGGGGTKVVVQATIQAQGEIGGARGSGLRFVSWGLEGAQMFVSEEDAGEEGDVSGSAPASPPVRRDSSLSGVSGGRSDASMRSIVDPFDVRVQMSLPEVLSRVPPPPRQAMGEAAQGQVEPGATLGENVVTVSVSTAVEAQLSYQDALLAQDPTECRN
ncbi:hypothetical protein T484DRAFT_1786606 [Baffinella frigidus]|nr:hypothetical protein T484DRAFT_1786606 [Cryptophyta sp. CCMP2293]